MSSAHFTYVTTHSPTLPSLYLCHIYELTERLENELCSLHLRHNSFCNPSVALPTSQLFLQPFRCFTYVTAHSPILLSLVLRHRLFTYVIWRAAHAFKVGPGLKKFENRCFRALHKACRREVLPYRTIARWVESSR